MLRRWVRRSTGGLTFHIGCAGLLASNDVDETHRVFLERSAKRVAEFALNMFKDLAGTRMLSQIELDIVGNPYRRGMYPAKLILGDAANSLMPIAYKLRSNPYVINRQTGLFYDTVKAAQTSTRTGFTVRLQSEAPYADALTEQGHEKMIGRPVWTRVAEATREPIRLHPFARSKRGKDMSQELSKWYARFVKTGRS